MSLHRSRPVDALQRIMTSFKHFEKKLDKLQDDVNGHGQTLTDLRIMVNNLSTGALLSPDIKLSDMKRPSKKTTAIQYDDRSPLAEPTSFKTKRNNAFQPLPNKLKAKSFQSSKINAKMSNDATFRSNKLMPATQKGLVTKRSSRARKTESPRKAILRQEKGVAKNHSKIISK